MTPLEIANEIAPEANEAFVITLARTEPKELQRFRSIGEPMHIIIPVPLALLEGANPEEMTTQVFKSLLPNPASYCLKDVQIEREKTVCDESGEVIFDYAIQGMIGVRMLFNIPIGVVED